MDTTTTTTITISTFQCLSDPSGCAAPGNTNMFGYPAHFDLQNANLQVDHMDSDTEWGYADDNGNDDDNSCDVG